jgi:hypothetical protein
MNEYWVIGIATQKQVSRQTMNITVHFERNIFNNWKYGDGGTLRLICLTNLMQSEFVLDKITHGNE